VRKLNHRRDTLEEIFLKAMGHIAHTPGEGLQPGNGSYAKLNPKDLADLKEKG
jgi:hypothetical protein